MIAQHLHGGVFQGGSMNSCDNCMFSGWLKGSELLKCHNPVSKNHKTENQSIFVCPDWVADEEIEEGDVNARKA